ncbi:hypothetical protein L914_21557 [Phytophthora nicotianae]|uniref:DDE-1 domain-containing protein n=2 Tax=Phytophthora nicotianae TaxID=4792 RepID=V9DST3_PHYNI|nr:hypothetical protein F443_23161 [Phytophthora nicotianae P1569]ETM30764.1 hypothetical protein L914_21557 [Phytophthora nicotianae]
MFESFARRSLSRRSAPATQSTSYWCDAWRMFSYVAKCIYQGQTGYVNKDAGPFVGSGVLWMDNDSGHCVEEVPSRARELRMKVILSPPNATEKDKPADRFPIQSIK